MDSLGGADFGGVERWGGEIFCGSRGLAFRWIGMDCGISEGDITSAIGSLGGAGAFGMGGGASFSREGSGGIGLGVVPCSMTY